MLIGVASSVHAQNSVLASGKWYKVAVEKNGVYKITYDQMRSMGFNPSTIEPSKIRIFGNNGGMLPQANATERPSDLTELAIHVQGESDGRFDGSDYILFYGAGPDLLSLDTQKEIFLYENNLYSDRNFYFVTVSTDAGKRIQTQTSSPSTFPVIQTFNDYSIHELDQYNDRKSGREWFGEIFSANTREITLNFPIEGIANNKPIKLVSSVMGQSLTPSSLSLFLNSQPIGEQILATIPNTTYGAKGSTRRDTILIDPVSTSASTNTTQSLRYSFTSSGSTSKAYLNFALLSFERALALYGNQTIFQSAQSLLQAGAQYQISNVPSDVSIWDITDHNYVKLQSFSWNNQTASFSIESPSLRKFITFNTSMETPILVGDVVNQNLHGLSVPDLLIVTHPTLKQEALRLATHRSSFNQLTVHVVTTEEVFHEFSSGRQDVTAIRDFAKYLKDKSATFKSLLLFGKCSYDYKDRIANNKNFVPTYESRNSLHPLQTYSSDDYFGFLENEEGDWREDPAMNHTLDIGVGRLPVTSAAEAKNIVDKLIQYDLSRRHFGAWRKQIVFVADDGSDSDGYTTLHQSQANQLGEFISDTNPGIDIQKLFMGSFPKEIRPGSESMPLLRDDIIRAFDRGSLIINYTGHGNEDQWGDEAVFNDTDIAGLQNDKFPFLVTATCEFGRHDDPEKISSAEKTITHANGGSIGLVTTARPVNATTNFNLNRAFYAALLTKENDRYLSIGEVFRRTKNNSVSGVSNRNFSLLGDPSMTLALPSNEVVVTSVKTVTGSDTLKALSTVIARGEVHTPQGEKLTTFDGTLEVTLFDKEVDFVTTGRNNPQFAYSQWSNALFRGKATIKNGEFEMRFMLPKNIAYQVDEGKLSLYALHDSLFTEAAGSYFEFKVGETESEVVHENQPPSIRLFIGDSTFVNGGVANPNTLLVANLRDNSGINISGYGVGNSIIATLDDDGQTYILNDYYIANNNDPTSGWLHFPLKNLTPGPHTITLTAWDLFNNSAEQTVDFIVTDGQVLVIEEFGNFPNPFAGKTTLFFRHNRSGDDLQAQLFIYNSSGEVVKSHQIFIPESDYQVNIMEFDPEQDVSKKLSAGLYLARLIIRSLSNGSKNELVTKLILVN
jgi:hypothetical protein